MIKDCKVSIIIPVFNRQKSIESCVRSVCRQSYKNLEILIVDDGSTDQTLQVCRRLQKKDRRIQIIEKKWGGVSSARNLGISCATGTYLQFADADDTLKTSATERLLQTMKLQQADLIICGYDKILSGIVLRRNQLDRPGKYSARNYLVQTLRDPGHHYYGAIWNKFYRRDIIENNGLRFNERVSLGEDFIFNLRYLSCISRVQVISDRLYTYNCMNVNTLSRYEKNLQSCTKELENRHIIYDEYKSAFTNFKISEQYEKQILQYWLNYTAVNEYYIRYHDMEPHSLAAWKHILSEDADVNSAKSSISRMKFEFLVLKIYWKNVMKKRIVKYRP